MTPAEVAAAVAEAVAEKQAELADLAEWVVRWAAAGMASETHPEQAALLGAMRDDAEEIMVSLARCIVAAAHPRGRCRVKIKVYLREI